MSCQSGPSRLSCSNSGRHCCSSHWSRSDHCPRGVDGAVVSHVVVLFQSVYVFVLVLLAELALVLLPLLLPVPVLVVPVPWLLRLLAVALSS